MDTVIISPAFVTDNRAATMTKRAHYSPPWADLSIIGIAGSSGSGKSTLSHAIVSKLNLPWVVILSMDSYYKPLDAESSKKAFNNEYDFDSPEAIDFDALLETLRDLKAGKRAEVPVYSFEKHQRMEETTIIYSPHVLILEGIFALYDQRVMELMDMRYVVPQRNHADIIVPRGIENRVAMTMVTQYIERKLSEKSTHHRAALKSLEAGFESEPLSKRVVVLKETPQLKGMNTLIQDIDTSSEDFIFYFDRFSCLLIEQALNNVHFKELTVETAAGILYHGLAPKGEVSAVLVLRGGATFEAGLRRVIPDCRTGRLLIQSNVRTGEPELHYLKLPKDISKHESVLLLDSQMSSGGSGLMAVQVLVDHGVPQDRIVFATYSAGRVGLHRLTKVFPEIAVVVGNMVPDFEERWVETRYFRC
ncbi:uridine kinase [Xylariaceae sp. AK1471]|nr:uridine kinase [Xylariaceae sp. AK1471]